MQLISKRTIADVKSHTDAIASSMEKNERNLLLDAFEESELGKVVYMSSYVSNYSNSIELTVTVKSGLIAEEVINYWKSALAGIRVNRFEDHGTSGSNPFRTYSMNMRDRDDDRRVVVNTYFAAGTCEFVEIKTGEIEDVPARPAEEAYSKEVVTSVLKCNDQDIPTGLPEPSLQLAD